MVSFSCEVCNDTVIKKKLDQHAQRCYGAYYTCIDCLTTFQGTAYRQHTQCISEAEKYEGALYQGKKGKGKQEKGKQGKQEKQVESKPEPKAEPKPESKPESKTQSKTESKSTTPLTKLAAANSSFYKVAKKLADERSVSLKQVLKDLKVSTTTDGKVVVSL